MCYSAESSIFSYLAAITGSIGLYKTNLIPESVFFGWIGHMQLIDYFLWKNQPCAIDKNNKVCKPDEIKTCNKVNQITTNTGIIINNLQPFVLFMAIILFSKNQLPVWVLILVLFFVIVMFLYTLDTFNNNTTIEKKCTYVTEQSDPHLYWQWNYHNKPFNQFIYTFFVLIFIILSYYGLSNPIFTTISIALSYVISALVYDDKKAIGNMWCYAGAFMPWLLLGYNQLI